MVLSRFVVLAVSGLLLFEATATPSAARAVEPLGAASPPPSASVAPSIAPAPSVAPSPAASAAPSVAPSPSAAPSVAPAPTPAPSATPAGSTAPADPPGPTGSPTPGSAPTDVAIGVGDVAALRTETSQTVQNANGSKTTTFFTEPVFYQPTEAAAWTPIRLGLSPAISLGPGGRRRRHLGRRPGHGLGRQPDRARRLPDRGPTASGRSPSAERTRPRAARSPTRSIHDGIADYPDFLPGVDLRVVPDAWGVKSFFAWKTAPAVPSISYLVDPGDLRLVARADGSIGLRRPERGDGRPDPPPVCGRLDPGRVRRWRSLH